MTNVDLVTVFLQDESIELAHFWGSTYVRTYLPREVTFSNRFCPIDLSFWLLIFHVFLEFRFVHQSVCVSISFCLFAFIVLRLIFSFCLSFHFIVSKFIKCISYSVHRPPSLSLPFIDDHSKVCFTTFLFCLSASFSLSFG